MNACMPPAGSTSKVGPTPPFAPTASTRLVQPSDPEARALAVAPVLLTGYRPGYGPARSLEVVGDGTKVAAKGLSKLEPVVGVRIVSVGDGPGGSHHGGPGQQGVGGDGWRVHEVQANGACAAGREAGASAWTLVNWREWEGWGAWADGRQLAALQQCVPRWHPITHATGKRGAASRLHKHTAPTCSKAHEPQLQALRGGGGQRLVVRGVQQSEIAAPPPPWHSKQVGPPNRRVSDADLLEGEGGGGDTRGRPAQQLHQRLRLKALGQHRACTRPPAREPVSL